MSYGSNFKFALIKRTLEITHEYSGPYDITLLVISLFGLIVWPKDAHDEQIKLIGNVSLIDWGIPDGSIICWGKTNNIDEANLSRLIRNLRDCLVHGKIRPMPEDIEVERLIFGDETGFRAEFRIEPLKAFVTRLANELLKAQ